MGLLIIFMQKAIGQGIGKKIKRHKIRNKIRRII